MQDAIEQFKTRAAAAAAELVPCRTWNEAAEIVLATLQAAGQRVDLLSGQAAPQKTVAMPDLFPELAEILEQILKNTATIIKTGLKKHVGGLDLGLAIAKAGIAESGSCLLDCAEREVRLATMLPEVSVILLRAADIVPALADLAPALRQGLKDSKQLTLITGPSRTADIERVLTLGAHGPVRLLVLLFKDWPVPVR